MLHTTYCIGYLVRHNSSRTAAVELAERPTVPARTPKTEYRKLLFIARSTQLLRDPKRFFVLTKKIHIDLYKKYCYLKNIYNKNLLK